VSQLQNIPMSIDRTQGGAYELGRKDAIHGRSRLAGEAFRRAMPKAAEREAYNAGWRDGQRSLDNAWNERFVYGGDL